MGGFVFGVLRFIYILCWLFFLLFGFDMLLLCCCVEFFNVDNFLLVWGCLNEGSLKNFDLFLLILVGFSR